jgi:hypothetical protein
MVRDTRHDSVHIFGAICPARGVGAAIIMPAVNTEAMNEHLAEISTQVAAGAHCLLVCDGAGWHQPGERLIVPDNITLLPLPAYAPELNPMENVWDYLRGNKLNSLVWESTKRCWKPANRHGCSWSTTRNASFPSGQENGRVSKARASGMMPRGLGFDSRPKPWVLRESRGYPASPGMTLEGPGGQSWC